ncbi:alpha-1,2-galactosyltransferase gmh3 [Planoprotostelium fungivorum]|uniref:Alpha-1,2-galactosyltransferase gmh3 n=1 Tax=Planoprotostelium fungivorum TaxID=1890364 RepID=A0A2P6NQQ0_9EUKA|nr:alpha-1,2-galactosyltransferase gmh3 [Planoprotostelium fungivorum]
MINAQKACEVRTARVESRKPHEPESGSRITPMKLSNWKVYIAYKILLICPLFLIATLLAVSFNATSQEEAPSFSREPRRYTPHASPFPGVEPGRVVIVQATNNKFVKHKPKNFMNLTAEIERKKEWAVRHNFDYYYEELDMDKFDYFARPSVFYNAFDKYPKAEWAWWIDIDTIFMEYQVNFTQFVLSQEAFDRSAAVDLEIKDILSQKTWKIDKANRYEDSDLIATKDLNGLNVGSFLLRRGEFANILLEIWESSLLKRLTKRDIDEQPALAYLMTEFEFVRQRTTFVVCELINALAFKYKQGRGQLIYHLAGCQYDTCTQWWKSGQRMKRENEKTSKANDKIKS